MTELLSHKPSSQSHSNKATDGKEKSQGSSSGDIPSVNLRMMEMVFSIPFVIATILMPAVPSVGILWMFLPELAGLIIILGLATIIVAPVLRVNPGSAFQIVAFLWAVAALPGTLVMVWTGWMIAPIFTIVALVASLIFAIVQFTKLRLWAFIVLFATGAVILGMISLLYSGLFVLAAICCMAHFLNKHFKAYAFIPLISFALVTLLGARGIYFYFLRDKTPSKDLLPSYCSTIFDYKNTFWRSKLESNAHFVVPSCKQTFLIGAKSSKHPSLIEIDMNLGRIKSFRLPLETVEKPVVCCFPNQIYMSEKSTHRLMELDGDNFSLKRELRLESGRPSSIIYDPAFEKLLIAYADKAKVEIIDRGQLLPIGDIIFDKPVSSMIRNPKTGAFYMVATDGWIYGLSPQSQTPYKVFQAPGFYFYTLNIDPESDQLFVSSILGKKVFAFNFIQGHFTAIYEGKHGMRHMAVDSKRKALYVANFFTGELLVLDTQDLHERFRMDVGVRPQDLDVKKPEDILSFSSSKGAFALDLNSLQRAKESKY